MARTKRKAPTSIMNPTSDDIYPNDVQIESSVPLWDQVQECRSSTTMTPSSVDTSNETMS